MTVICFHISVATWIDPFFRTKISGFETKNIYFPDDLRRKLTLPRSISVFGPEQLLLLPKPTEVSPANIGKIGAGSSFEADVGPSLERADADREAYHWNLFYLLIILSDPTTRF